VTPVREAGDGDQYILIHGTADQVWQRRGCCLRRLSAWPYGPGKGSMLL
jgi:hypothetical protein